MLINHSINVFLFSLILNFSLFGHSESENLIPKSTIETLQVNYSPKEKTLIQKDLNNIRETCFSGYTSNKELTYLATAGAPGASKSTILETYINNDSNFIYLDPDQRALKFMINTYYQSLDNYKISKAESYSSIQKEAYNKWRDASNYITNTLLNEAFEKGYSIAHGITSDKVKVITPLYEKLKQKKYKIILLLCASTNENRLKAIEYRTTVQGFYQCAPEDIMSKSKMFLENFPIYFKYADEIHIFWTENFLDGSKEIAIAKKGETLKVIDQELLDKLKKDYEDVRRNNLALPLFDDLIISYSKA